LSAPRGEKTPAARTVVFIIMARSAINEPHRACCRIIGLATPVDGSQHGYPSEHHSTGETAQKAGDYAEDMAMEMLATHLGLPNDPRLAWNEKEGQWRLSNKIHRTQNFIQSAEGHKDGLWTTVISGARAYSVISKLTCDEEVL
jgi:arginine decarboxylase